MLSVLRETATLIDVIIDSFVIADRMGIEETDRHMNGLKNISVG